MAAHSQRTWDPRGLSTGLGALVVLIVTALLAATSMKIITSNLGGGAWAVVPAAVLTLSKLKPWLLRVRSSWHRIVEDARPQPATFDCPRCGVRYPSAHYLRLGVGPCLECQALGHH